ncbi:MAG TPA: OmpA family protein [Usitatibacteraceae bacterium]|nr:OmpA family protein [Usitatibacteraceae bacterium]
MKIKVNAVTRSAVALALAATLAACASAPKSNVALDDARSAYDRASGDAQVARSAPVELRKAQESLRQAEAALRSGDDPGAVEHYAYLARRNTEIAVQADKVAQAERAVADASLQRDRIIIEARTRDAQAQRALADKARIEAESQRSLAEAQRSEAESQRGKAEAARKLAEARLAAAQASQAQAASARAHARTLEEELEQLKAKQTERGMVLTLGDVLFDTGRAKLQAGAARTLDQLVAFLNENPERAIEIEGHTDSTGTAELNRVLSERRAESVKSALVDRGIAPERISARGLGLANPVASNDTAAGRQLNRRVEIVVPRKT